MLPKKLGHCWDCGMDPIRPSDFLHGCIRQYVGVIVWILHTSTVTLTEDTISNMQLYGHHS